MPPGRMRLADLPDDLNDLSAVVLDGALEVHRAIGNRLTEKVYRESLAHELRLRGLKAETEHALPLRYKELVLPRAFFVDILVEDRLIVELKCADDLSLDHESQVVTYLHMSGLRLGMLFNFRSQLLRDGFRRLVR